jgi:hypothetical protein
MACREVVTIVEGHGDVEAVNILVRRVAAEIDASTVVKIPVKIRCSKGQLCNKESFIKRLEIARRFVGSGGSVLVVMDADEDCPREINGQLLGWAKDSHGDLKIGVVVIKREMESWFVAGSDLWDQAQHGDAESVRDPKRWVADNVVKGHYAETVDQGRIAAGLNIDKAKESGSFRKFVRDVARLLSAS